MASRRRSMHNVPLTSREALLFEAGVKLGGIFHQYLGIPVSSKTATALARSIEAAVALQPFVARVRVRIVPARGGARGRGLFGYRYITAEMLDARVTLIDGATRVVARLSYRPDLRYPLMRIESAKTVRRAKGRRAA
jgi:dihydroneopterin aldolase